MPRKSKQTLRNEHFKHALTIIHEETVTSIINSIPADNKPRVSTSLLMLVQVEAILNERLKGL